MAQEPADNETISSAQADYDALRNVSPEQPCPYLEGRLARSEAYAVQELDGVAHERLMDFGFRRSGRIVYRPRCRGCRACVPLRVRVDSFARTRSMRRVWRRNADVRVIEGDAKPTDEKAALFVRYLDAQHDNTMARTNEAFRDFLYGSPTDTCEFCYLLGTRLVGVSLADRCPSGLSSVYMFFDPDQRERSLGTYSILWEIDCCRREGWPYYFLGYHVAGSRTMAYKVRFRPNETLTAVGGWTLFRE